MQSLIDFLKEYDKIIFDFSILEKYIETDEFGKHSSERARYGRIDTGSVGGSKEEFKDVVRKSDSIIENWMLNNKVSYAEVGLRFFGKGYLIAIIGYVENFDNEKFTYNFRFKTVNKYYTRNTFSFHDVDFIIEIKNNYAKQVNK